MNAEAGYLFYPSPYRPAIGHSKLDVFLRSAPTGRVFDTAGLHLRVLDPGLETPATLAVVHNPELPERHHRVAAGRFWLFDFRGHALEGFSFGGKLMAVRQEERTFCSFESNAPIFELDPDSFDVERVFVDTLEAVAGVLRAEWRDGNDAEWLANLVTVDPFSLFVSSLASVQSYLDSSPSNGDEGVDLARLRAWVRRAVHSLRGAGEWPEHPPTLAEMEQARSRSQAQAFKRVQGGVEA